MVKPIYHYIDLRLQKTLYKCKNLSTLACTNTFKRQGNNVMRNLVKGNYITRKEETINEENPFIPELVEKIRTGPNTIAVARNSRGMLIDDNGEMTNDMPVIGFQRIVEKKTTFVKLYIEGIRNIFGLPKAATNVLAVLLEAYQNDGKFNSTSVYMNYRSASKDHAYPYKEKTYINGINTLIANGIIGLTINQSWYYINPNFFFKGDRYKIVQEYVNKRADSAKQIMEDQNPLSVTA